MINFSIGFFSCFLFLLLLGQIKRIVLFFKRRKTTDENRKEGPDEQVAMGETVVAVLNSGKKNEKVISNISKQKPGLWKFILNKIKS